MQLLKAFPAAFYHCLRFPIIIVRESWLHGICACGVASMARLRSWWLDEPVYFFCLVSYVFLLYLTDGRSGGCLALPFVGGSDAMTVTTLTQASIV